MVDMQNILHVKIVQRKKKTPQPYFLLITIYMKVLIISFLNLYGYIHLPA